MPYWSVYAKFKTDPKRACGFLSQEKPTSTKVKEWREYHDLGEDWEVTVSEVEGELDDGKD